jgi:hypothetical protein
MTGIFHIVLARKPLEGTIAENCLQWGCGAINIGGCRVKGTKGTGVWGTSNQTINRDRKFNASPGMGDYRSEAVVENDGLIGRFPANLILGHCENCRRQGTKKIKGNVPVASGYDRLNKKQAELGYRPGEYQKGEVEPGYSHTDADGKETIEVWECEEGCVMMGFPLTGVSTGGKTGAVGSGGRYNGGWNGTNPGISAGGFGDSGSASRFFFNFSEQESDE